MPLLSAEEGRGGKRLPPASGHERLRRKGFAPFKLFKNVQKKTSTSLEKKKLSRYQVRKNRSRSPALPAYR